MNWSGAQPPPQSSNVRPNLRLELARHTVFPLEPDITGNFDAVTGAFVRARMGLINHAVPPAELLANLQAVDHACDLRAPPAQPPAAGAPDLACVERW